ncbi:hypothetical protein AB0M29_41220 [Streptomyces sp. NPDC051976]|uniref:hypothetical protein n=1 Tax=Streptomyces sp. NPDC051976 TaxID=3154947 RepID=UPI00342E5281
MSLSRVRAAVAAASLALGICATALAPNAVAAPARSAVPVSAAAVASFTEPSFAVTCTWHSFGEGEQPPWWLVFADPLCVEYSKRDITFDDGGALTFLLAEPARFAVALSTCRYYQKDHWSVQTTTGATPLVAWDGQYWWDRTGERAGARLTHFRIDGQTVGIGDAAAALRAHGFPHVADVLDDYGQAPGESGATVSLPFDARCALFG